MRHRRPRFDPGGVDLMADAAANDLQDVFMFGLVGAS
jgi:hypothetical protein